MKCSGMAVIFGKGRFCDYKYLPTHGIEPCRINLYTELIHGYSKLFFGLLDKHRLYYALFAGQSIGMARNGANVPWVDDYDIIFFRKSICKITIVFVTEI